MFLSAGVVHISLHCRRKSISSGTKSAASQRPNVRETKVDLEAKTKMEIVPSPSRCKPSTVNNNKKSRRIESASDAEDKSVALIKAERAARTKKGIIFHVRWTQCRWLLAQPEISSFPLIAIRMRYVHEAHCSLHIALFLSVSCQTKVRIAHTAARSLRRFPSAGSFCRPSCRAVDIVTVRIALPSPDYESRDAYDHFDSVETAAQPTPVAISQLKRKSRMDDFS